MKQTSKIIDPEKILVMQQDESDCGVACLQTIIKYYGGYCSLESLRELSGTTIKGTTLLGLYQAATAENFSAEGCEADLPSLIAHPTPVILHVVIDNIRQHYIVCFGSKKIKNELRFIIGDPGRGIVYLTAKELTKIWTSKTCLLMSPNEKFVSQKCIKKDKRKNFLYLIEKDKSLLLIAAFIGVFIALLGITMSVFSQKLIDDVLPKKEFSKLYIGCILVLIILILKEGITYVRGLLLLRQGQDFNKRIIDKFYTHLLKLPKHFYYTRKTGEFVARLNDTSRIQNVIALFIGNAIMNILITLVTTVVLFFYSWKIAIFCMVITPFYFWLILKYNALCGCN